MGPTIQIVHAIPGRIRRRVPALIADPELAERILAAGMAHPGVRRIRINLACASVLVEGDPRGSAVNLVGHWLTATPPDRAPSRDAPRPRTHGSMVQLAFSLAGIAVSFLGGGGIGVPVALTVVGA